MRILSCLTLFLIAPLLCGAAIADPVGDTYGTGMPFDIVSVSGVTNVSSTTFEIRFTTPIPAGLDANLWGAIEIDADRDINTGKTSELDYPTMNFPLGVDYVIAFWYDDELGTASIVDVTNDTFDTVVAEYGADFFRITVPIGGRNGDPRMNFAVGVGDGLDINSAYSDIAGNDYQILTTETPEPATWALCGVSFGVIALARRRRRA